MNAGTSYFINDGSLTNDTFSTVVGNDANSGKSPSTPMASIEALLNTYDLNPGDTVYVDSGLHLIPRDIVISNSDSGVRFVGPADRSAILSRVGGNSGNSLFRLDNSDNVTFENIDFRANGGAAIRAFDVQGVGNGSDNLTVRNSFFTNNAWGIHLGEGNHFASILDSNFDGGPTRNQSSAIRVLGNNAVVTGNMFSRNGVGGGITVHLAQNGLVESNQFIDNTATNVLVSTGSIVRSNIIRDGFGNGVSATAATVENNTIFNMGVFGNPGFPLGGITGFGLFRNNTIFNTQVGIVVSPSSASASNALIGNTLYNNVQAGVWAAGFVRLDGNRIFSNPVGVRAYNSGDPLIINNLIYSNATGVVVDAASAQVANNTIYQLSGDAILSTQGFTRLQLENNIVSVGTGTAIALGSLEGTLSGDYNQYQIRGAGRLARFGGVDYSDVNTWSYAQNIDRNSFIGDPQFVDIDGADNQLGFTTANFSTDDDFRVQATSPSIDRGNPFALAASEPTPNGNRINLGHTGNTSQATTGPEERVYVLSPNGLEKFEQGQVVPVSFSTAGYTPVRPVAQLITGASATGYWNSAVTFQQTGSLSTSTAAIDRTLVVNPAPESAYQRPILNNGVGSTVDYRIPVRNGNYNVRLHFAETNTFIGVGGRRFDIRLQGSTVQGNFDVLAASGAANRAIATAYSGIAVTSGFLDVSLLSLTANGALLSAIEITADEAVTVFNPTFNIQYSNNSGATWTTIAANVPVDHLGRGSFQWTATEPTNARSSLFRVISQQGLSVSDTSDQTFEVVNNGTEYYVSLTGNDANSGKAPDRPMRNLSAVLQSFNLDAGDRINVAAGTYLISSNIVLNAEDSGVTIQGPAGATAVFDRQNLNEISSQYVFELQNADNVTFDSLSVTLADFGIFANNSSDSDDVVVRNSRIYGNQTAGILVGVLNDRWTIRNNEVFGLPGGNPIDNQFFGISLRDTIDNLAGNDHLIEGNDIFDNSIGINLAGLRSTARNNEIHGNATGVRAFYNAASLADGLYVLDNEIYSNTVDGINSGGQITITGNEVYGQTTVNRFGIIANQGLVADNIVRNNANGMDINGASVRGNRIVANATIGLRVNLGAEVVGNRIYSNSTGVQATTSYTGNLASNIIYANTNRGLQLNNSGASTLALVANNTIYQPVGEAVRLENFSKAELTNNIIWILSGYGINAGTINANDFRSDYNLLHRSNDPNARIGLWAGVDRNTLVDWQTATARDANSLGGDPLFVDINGADGILGHNTTNGDGGADDNFQRLKNSPATDRGDGLQGWVSDLDGFVAVDDLGVANAGRQTLVPTVLSSSLFTATGVAQPTWRGYQNATSYTLPFAFPFFGTNYTTVFVSSSGFLQFGSSNSAGDIQNSPSSLSAFPRIAALWDNLRTDINTAPADNIYLDTSIAGQVKFRWDGTNVANNTSVNFAIVLFSDGRIRFDYGAGNTGLTPTVGISIGNGRTRNLVPGYDGAATLTNANSIEFNSDPGFRDMGAVEFRGNSLDALAPTLVSTVPTVVDASGRTVNPLSQLVLNFSEELNPIDARSPASYELRSSGVNGIFADFDDVVYRLAPQYLAGQNSVNLVIGRPDGTSGPVVLPVGTYRLTISGSTTSSLFDLSGNRFDGDANGAQGGDYQRIFRVISNSQPILVGANPLPGIVANITSATNTGILISDLLQNQVTDPDGPARGIAVTAAASIYGSWEYALDGQNFLAVLPKLTGNKALLLAADNNSRLRFVPSLNTTRVVNDLVFRGWDQADGLIEGTDALLDLLSANSISNATANASVQVTRFNTAPTNIQLSQQTIGENLSPGTQVGLLTAVDDDPADQHTYALINGVGSDDNSAFEIVGNSLRLRGTANFETKSQYLIRIRAVDTSNNAFEKSFTIGVTDLPEMVGDVVFGDGTTQRSIIRRLEVTFDGTVDIQSGAFSLVKLGSNGGPVTLAINQALNGQGQSVVTITFGSLTNGSSGALSDGYYMLTINGTQILRNGQALDLNLDGVGGDSLVRGEQESDNFFALFGDTNGDGVVGIAEFGQFRASFGKLSSDPAYDARFDYEQDGAVGVSDFGQFRSRFGKPKRPFGT